MPLIASCLAFLAIRPQELVARNQPAREIWVFRSVLDHHARIATVSLAPGFWLSYDATNCGLYKFWKGDIKFDGAVYTTVHGPQPTSLGGAIEEGSTEDDVWKVSVGGQAQKVKPRYRGHFFDLKDKNVVHFRYDFKVGSQNYQVYETPTALWRGGQMVGVRRQFSVGNYVGDKFTGAGLKGVSFGITLGKANGIFGDFKASGGTYSVVDGKNEFRFEGDLATVDALSLIHI